MSPLPQRRPVHNPEKQPEWQHQSGARLQQLRLRSGLTQEQLALTSGLYRTYVGAWSADGATPPW